jgi:hypothetical protein
MPPLTEITDEWVEASAEELYFQASRGKAWQAASHDIRQQFRAITRTVIERGQVAEIASRANRKGVLP